ncbi:MAG: amino acid--tRNA ligase-related protein [Patescibacteria group bacterium]
MNIYTAIQNLANYKKYLQVEEFTHTYLKKKGYLKTDLPVLSPALIPESYLEVFETELRHNKIYHKLYLTPSPELFLKRLLAYGAGNCYCLGKAFRNADPSGGLHMPEFTMLEFYKTKANYMDIASEVLSLLRFIADNMTGGEQISYQGKRVTFSRWEKISVIQAFFKYAGITEKELFNHRLFLKIASKKGYKTHGFTYQDLFSQIYVQEIEPHLGKGGYPTLIYDYPKEFAALAKLNTDGRTAQRFEFYIEGVELGDCYTELTDANEQKKRFIHEQKLRKQLKKKTHPVDKGLVQALEYGLTDCAGIAIGFERMAMIFADVTSIAELKLIHINI